MVPITELRNGDLHVGATHQKPEGWRAWIGENMMLGVMLAGAALAAFTLFSGLLPGLEAGTTLATTLGLGTAGGFAATIGAIATGGLIGGYFDKQENERRAEEGITVDKPSYFNRGILTEGLLKGGLNGMVLAVGAMSLLGMIGGWLGITAATGLAAFAVGGSLALPIAIAAGAALIGAVRGSISRKQTMEKNYNQVKVAHLMQTGQVEQARGLMQQLGAPAMAAGVGVGAGVAATTGKAKAVSVDPGTVVGAVTGLHDLPEKPPLPETPAANAYDFSGMESHPAHQARGSFLETEMQRRAAMGISSDTALGQ